MPFTLFFKYSILFSKLTFYLKFHRTHIIGNKNQEFFVCFVTYISLPYDTYGYERRPE